MMWQHKELHELFKQNNLKDSDFYSGTLPRNGAANRKARSNSGTTLNNEAASTLARPISSQGAERPARFKTPLLDESAANVESKSLRRYDVIGTNTQITPTTTPNSVS